MKGLPSECSNGCESGWTMYLEHYSVSADPYTGRGDGFVDGDDMFYEYYSKERGTEEDGEEDLSMVSDASSGPPHFHKDEDGCDDNGCFCSASSVAVFAKSDKKQKTRHHRDRHKHQPSSLDDTASSPVLNISKNKLAFANNQASMENVLDFSQGFSATYVKGKSTIQKHFSFLQSSLPEGRTQPKPAKFLCLSDGF